MRGILLLTFLSAFAGAQALSVVNPSQQAESIGQIGFKEYFEIDVGTKVNWLAAKQICNDASLEFGSTETNAEFSFLYSKRKGNDYWVAASLDGFSEYHYGTYKAFEWEDGTSIPNNINFHQSSELWQCLYFSGDDQTYVDFCLSGQHKVLCQQRHQ